MAGPFRRSPGERDERSRATDPPVDPSVDSIARELRDAFFGFLAFAQLVRGDPRIPSEVHITAGLMAEEAERARILSDELAERARGAERASPGEELPPTLH